MYRWNYGIILLRIYVDMGATMTPQEQREAIDAGIELVLALFYGYEPSLVHGWQKAPEEASVKLPRDCEAFTRTANTSEDEIANRKIIQAVQAYAYGLNGKTVLPTGVPSDYPLTHLVVATSTDKQ